MKSNITINSDIYKNQIIVMAETWETILGQFVAEVDENELVSACRQMCGMADCICGGYRGYGFDDLGREYVIIVSGILNHH